MPEAGFDALKKMNRQAANEVHESMADDALPIFFPIWKIFLYNFLTFGFFSLFWAYSHMAIQKANGSKINPLIRAFLFKIYFWFFILEYNKKFNLKISAIFPFVLFNVISANTLNDFQGRYFRDCGMITTNPDAIAANFSGRITGVFFRLLVAAGIGVFSCQIIPGISKIGGALIGVTLGIGGSAVSNFNQSNCDSVFLVEPNFFASSIHGIATASLTILPGVKAVATNLLSGIGIAWPGVWIAPLYNQDFTAVHSLLIGGFSIALANSIALTLIQKKINFVVGNKTPLRIVVSIPLIGLVLISHVMILLSPYR